MFYTWLVGLPTAGDKDEWEEHHTRADDWDEFHRLLKHDIEVSMHASGISCPPKEDPVNIDLIWVSMSHISVVSSKSYLVVRNQQYSFWEVKHHLSIWLLSDLSPNALICYHSNSCRAQPLMQCEQQQRDILLDQSLPGVVPVPTDPVKGSAENLLNM